MPLVANIVSVVGYVTDDVIKQIVDKCTCVPIGSVLKLDIWFKRTDDTCVDATISGTFQLSNTTTSEVIVDDTLTDQSFASNYNYLSADFTITNPGEYQFIYEVVICGETFTNSFTFTVCQGGKVEYVSCGKYLFSNTLGVDVTVSAQTPAMVGTSTYQFQNILVLAGETYEFTLTTPGIYIVTYTYTINSVLQVFSIQVNFFCTIEACLTKLITQVLCATEEDPCCKECNDEAKKKAEALRYELNKLMALYGYYLALNFYQTITYLGVFGVTTEVLAGLVELDNVIQKIIKLTSSCGPAKCAEDTITVVNCGC